jgi:hypothetical protein
MVSKQDGMKGADMWAAYQVNNKWMLEDMIAAGQSIPKIDDHQVNFNLCT